MTRAPLNQIVRVRPETSDAVQIGAVVGDVSNADSRAAQIIRTYYLTDEIRGHLRNILTSIAKGNQPGPARLQCNSWLLDAGIGAGKSHFLAFLMVLLTQKEAGWCALIDKETELAPDRPLSDDVILKGIENRRHLVVPIDLTTEPVERSLAQILVRAMKEAFKREAGEPLPVEPDERLIQWLYKSPLRDSFSQWLRAGGTDERKEKTLRQHASPQLATRIREYCVEQQIEPNVTPGWDESLSQGVEAAEKSFNGGVVFMVDELSRFMARRRQARLDEADITTLQRIARNMREEGARLWFVGTENVATSREVTQQIKGPGTMTPLTLSPQDFGKIVLYRCRALPEAPQEFQAARAKIEVYWSALRGKLEWVNRLSLDAFAALFPYEPTLIELTRRVCLRMAETRTGIQILHSALHHHAGESRLITADMIFDELEGRVGGSDARANVFEETEEHRAVYRVCRDVFDRIERSGEIPAAFQTKALSAIKALVLFHLAEPERYVSAEEILEILSEEWDSDRTRQTALINFTGILDRLPSISQGHVEKDAGGYRFSVEGQVSIRPDWEAEKERLRTAPGGYSPRTLLKELVASEVELREGFFQGLTLDGTSKTLSRGLVWKGFAVKGVARLIDLAQTSKLDPPSKREQNQDFALYVALLDDPARAPTLLQNCGDERVILWTPKSPGQAEMEDLLAFEALRNIRRRYARGEKSDDAEKLSRADAEMAERRPTVLNHVKASFVQGTLKTRSQTLNVAKADVQTALTATVPEVLKDAYREHALSIPGNQPLDDAGVLRLANGLVRHERWSSGIPNDQWDAARNFAHALQLSPSTQTPELDLTGSVYAARIKQQIEQGSGSVAFNVLRDLYCDRPHGLSPRLLSLYLLAMSRKAEVVLETKSGPVSRNVIESGLTFASGARGFIDEIQTVSRSKAPEPWDKILDVANAVLHPEQASPVRSDSNYAALSRQVQEKLDREAAESADWKARLEEFAASAGVPSGLPRLIDKLRAVHTLHGLDRNPSDGLETLWATVRDGWGEDPQAFALACAAYRQAREFLRLRRDDVVRAARALIQEIPEGSDPRWRELRKARQAVEAVFDLDRIMVEPAAWTAYDAAQARLRDVYTSAYTEAHARYYARVQETRQDVCEVLDGVDLACLEGLEIIPEIGGQMADAVKRGLSETLGRITVCQRVLHDQLRSGVRCACGIRLTDSYSNDLAVRCLDEVQQGLARALAVLQGEDVKAHLLAVPDAGDQPGLRELLELRPGSPARMVELVTPELAEWLRIALSTLRSVEVVLDGLPIPASFAYGEARGVAAGLEEYLRQAVDRAIDDAGFRKDVESGKSVVVRIRKVRDA